MREASDCFPTTTSGGKMPQATIGPITAGIDWVFYSSTDVAGGSVLSYVKLFSLAASLIIATHVFKNPDFGLALCFAAFAASSLDLLCFETAR
jgi:hypothetical protein